jgi:4-alpha-glucanotransferase
LGEERIALLKRAAARVDMYGREKIAAFIATHKELDDAARFLALRTANADTPWTEWTVTEPSEGELFFWQFVQYEFFTQWLQIKQYANRRGIRIIGDIPIYVAYDSCDV